MIIGGVAILMITLAYSFGTSVKPQNEVVIYVSHDQDYSEPVLQAFELETGIKVRAVYDTEASKTVGLVNRLIAEKNNPIADVFWNNEVTRSIELKNQGVLEAYQPQNFNLIDSKYKDPDGYWTGFAARARVLLVNTDLLNGKSIPQSLEDLTTEDLLNQVTIADPRFGTTGSQMAALYTVWGADEFRSFVEELAQNSINIAQSNGQTRNKVVDGEKSVGLTDTDDANDAIADGVAHVQMIIPDQGPNQIGTLLIPNSVMLIKSAPHQTQARLLIDYLISARTESALASSKSVQIPLLPNVTKPDNVLNVQDVKVISVDWATITQNLAPALEIFQSIIPL